MRVRGVLYGMGGMFASSVIQVLCGAGQFQKGQAFASGLGFALALMDMTFEKK